MRMNQTCRDLYRRKLCELDFPLMKYDTIYKPLKALNKMYEQCMVICVCVCVGWETLYSNA